MLKQKACLAIEMVHDVKKIIFIHIDLYEITKVLKYILATYLKKRKKEVFIPKPTSFAVFGFGTVFLVLAVAACA